MSKKFSLHIVPKNLRGNRFGWWWRCCCSCCASFKRTANIRQALTKPKDSFQHKSKTLIKWEQEEEEGFACRRKREAWHELVAILAS